MRKNKIYFRKYFFLLSVLFLSSMYSFLHAQDLLLTNHDGVTYRNKPSLVNRMSGVKKVYVFYPNVSSQDDRYIYKNFIIYLQRLGLQVIEHSVSYKTVDVSENGYPGYILSCSEDISHYLDGVNILVVAINIMHVYDTYTGEHISARFTFMDPFNRYIWTEDIEPANKAEKYIKQCQKKICSYYSYNSSYTYQPPYISSNYSNLSLRSYIDKGQYTPIEGIYEGDNNTLGVKKASDGSYYLIYHSSKKGASGWQDGYVKAVLRETSIPGVYRGTWYGRYFQKFDCKIIFENGMFTTYVEDSDKEVYLKMYPTASSSSGIGGGGTIGDSEWTGTGFALTNNYIVTNYHVVEDAKTIQIQGVNGNFNNKYNATVVATDKYNDLALLKVSGCTISSMDIPYSVKTFTSDVGEEVFVLGYPLTSTMGDEIKLTTGVVSSKTGFQGDVSQYQISAPIQPGNSGGPLFDSKGNVIGIVSAKHRGAENVGYAIKASYLRNLMESAVSTNILPQNNKVSSLNLSGKVKAVKNYVYYITCSSSGNGTSDNGSSYSGGSSYSSGKTYNNPSINTNCSNKTRILSVTIEDNRTIVKMSNDNRSRNGGYYAWMTLDPQTYIMANGHKYTLTKADGIALSPNKTYFSYEGETKTFTLYFPSIPKSTSSIDLVESSTSEWRFYGIQLR